MDSCHAVQPCLPELGGAGIGLSQAVLEVHQHLWVILMLLHLGCGHQDCADPLGQIFHIGGKAGVLDRRRGERTHDFHPLSLTHTSQDEADWG